MKWTTVITTGLTFATASVALSAMRWDVIANFQMGSTSGVSKADMSSGLMDLEPEGQNDQAPELTGEIKNADQKTQIKDVSCWFEDSAGGKLTTPSGGCPFGGLSTGSSASGLQSASLVSNTGGISTFNLAEGIPAGSTFAYAGQVEGFDEPNQFKACMSFSSTKAETETKHYQCINSCFFTLADPDEPLGGLAPTIHDGVELEVTNSQGGNNALLWLRTTLVSNDPALTITAGEVRGDDGNVIPGTSASITNSGKKIVITGLSVTTGQTVTVWLDLNHAYTADTNFNVHAGYTTFNPGGH